MSPFENAWQILKELDTQDLQQAARTGGIGMTPERRQAYTDAGLPLNTGGGFRTMPDTEAQRLMGYQKTGSREAIDGYTGDPKHPLFDPRHKAEIAEFLHQDDTGGNLDMDDRLYDLHHILTQGQSIQDPMEIQEPTDVGTQGVRGEKTYGASGRVQITPGPRRTVSEEPRRFLKPFTATDPPKNPESEFSRRGEAGVSPSNQAFEAIQQRRERAEAHKQMLADRQKEIMMRQQQARMQSRQPTMKRNRRRGQGPNSRKNRMKQRRN